MVQEREDLENARVISMHNAPRSIPEEWDCGCVTKPYTTDRDFLRGEKPFEMRLAHDCKSADCEIRKMEGDIRSRAVAAVDRRHGYTVEFSSTPRTHAEEYDDEEDLLRALSHLPSLQGSR